MTPSGCWPWLIVLLCSPLWHSEGVEGWGGLAPAPSESECRPYIEKALKEKDHTPETPQEAVDATDSEQQTPSSQTAGQEGSIEETEEVITKESIEEKHSDTTQVDSEGESKDTGDTTESKEEASIENTTAESLESPQNEESLESAETQDITQGDLVGEEKKTEESSETDQIPAEQLSTEDEPRSAETSEHLEATSMEDTAAEQQSGETPDESTKEETSIEEGTKSAEGSLEQPAELDEQGNDSSQVSKEDTEEKKSEEGSAEGTTPEEASIEEKTAELPEATEDSIENSPSSTEDQTTEDQTTEDQTAEESIESPGGEVTDSAGSSESLETTESADTQESVETGAEGPIDSVEETTETNTTSAEETKDAPEKTSVEDTNTVEDISLETTDASIAEEAKESNETSIEDATETTAEPEVISDKIEATPTVVENQEGAKDAQKEATEEPVTEKEPVASEEVAKEQELTVEDQLTLEFETPLVRRPRDHIAEILHLTPESAETELLLAKTIDATLKELKKLYDVAIKPLEILYKYRDLSNRHFGDPEIFSKPLILFMGPWSGGKSTILNYLLDNEFKASSLRTGAEPSPAYFNLLMWGEREEVLDGTQLAADWTFSGLQKFGQGLLDRLRGLRLNSPLLEKVNIVEIPGILEIRKQVERLFPFNDACQWFIDRADIIFLVYDPSKLDVGPETEAILDQLKGREYQTRIILNKADQVKPEELMRVQGTLIWNISPLMSSQEPPVMYSTSLWSIPYEQGAPSRLLHAQERAFLRDLRHAVDKRVENKIASARRFAVRVRNHAKMVDCYLTTYYNHKTFFGNRKKVADDIVEHPQNYHIYEGLSTLTNISRYDLPDPEVYRDFFRLNPLYDFQRLSDTCTYFRGCPINRLDVAIAYDLPELIGKWRKQAERVLESASNKQGKS